MNNPGSKYQVNITPNAIANIKEIIDFYIRGMNYPPAAKEFRDDVYAKLKLISENPYLYGIPDNLPDFAELGYHKAPVYKHQALLYLIDEGNKIIQIIYAVDTRRNLWLITPIKLMKQ